MKKAKWAAAAGITILLMTGLIIYSNDVTEAVILSTKRCICVIVPSLFAFMSVSGFIVRTGLTGIISKPFDLTVGKILKMPAGAAAQFIISNTAGYPVGASMLSEAVRTGQTDKRSAEAMLIYCYAGGPAYLINAVGYGIFGNKAAGLSVFLSTVTANLLLAAIINRIYRPKLFTSVTKCGISSESLISSITDAGEKLFAMCFMIIWFSAVTTVVKGSGLPARASELLGLNRSEAVLIGSLFEITSSSALDRNAIGYLPQLAAVCCFGGVCVILQLHTVIKNSFGIKLFLKWMPVRMILVFCINKLYNWIFMDNSIPAFAEKGKIIVELNNLLPSLCLIMMIFILVLQKRLDFLKRV